MGDIHQGILRLASCPRKPFTSCGDKHRIPFLAPHGKTPSVSQEVWEGVLVGPPRPFQ